MAPLRRVTEGLARKTTRRGLFGRGADIVFGALIGAAAGTLTQRRPASAGFGTACAFPGPACPCDGCLSNGVCAKPCVINTTFYVAGCWVTSGGSITCCDCSCDATNRNLLCGCGTDFHNDPANCPDGTA